MVKIRRKNIKNVYFFLLARGHGRELARAVTAAAREHDLVVLRNHGLVAVGRDPDDILQKLERMGLEHEHWLRTVEGYGSLFRRVVGRAESMAEVAKRAGRRWFKGLSGLRRMYAGTRTAAARAQ